MMRAFQPHNDWRDRSWTYSRIGHRKGSWYGPYRRRRWRSYRYPEGYRVVFAILAVLGALFLGAVFLMLLNEWIAR
jgi:hypothetical protein